MCARDARDGCAGERFAAGAAEASGVEREMDESSKFSRPLNDGRQRRAGVALVGLVLAAALLIAPTPGMAQQALPTAAVTGEQPAPSEADRAALRYFATQGEYDRLEAELRRLQALYPTWQPPRDLLAPPGGDPDLQRIYDMIGEQRYDEARAIIASRQSSDPGFEPPARITELLELAEIRQELRAADERGDMVEVLRLAERNERILTCEDVDSIWRVAAAFAATGRPQRAYDAYAYVINSCVGQDAERAATLEKAATTLSPQYVTQLFALGRSGPDGNSEFQSAELSILRGAVARGGADEAVTVPQAWLDRLAEHAGTGTNLDDAMLVGFYLYRHGQPAPAAQWFRFALENGHGAPAAEAYILALRATGSREDEFLAREVAYEWRNQSPELMEAYLDAMATVLTADASGDTSIQDVEQISVDRYAPVVLEQRDPIGAQALGWYAFNTCQFSIAEEWFVTSANWVPTEAAVYGLALARQRLGDRIGFREIVEEWGPLYPSVEALVTGGAVDPADPSSGARDDVTDETGVAEVVCDPNDARSRPRRRVLEANRAQNADPVLFTAAGSAATTQRGSAPASDFVIAPRDVAPRLYRAQATVPLPPSRQSVPPLPQGATAPAASAPPLPPGAQPVAPPQRVAPQRTPTSPALTSTPQRFQANSAPAARRPASTSTLAPRNDPTDRRVREIVSRPRATTSRRTGGGGSVQGALARRDFGQCVALSNGAIRSGRISAADATARGYCLLELERPVEAQHAFAVAQMRAPYRSRAASEAAYGASVVALVRQETDVASVAAASAPMTRARRTEIQTQVLQQRAVGASNLGQTSAAVHFLEQRNDIAPLQKDLMLLQAYAYHNGGDSRSANRLFRALEGTGLSKDIARGAYEANIRRYPSAFSSGNSDRGQ
ncbi:MAG: hypothetical protein AcusKO_01660 [Acuticoccus sp.]